MDKVTTMDPRIPVNQDIAMSVIEQEFEDLRAENERLRVDLARAHWDTREQQRVSSELMNTLEAYASTSNWEGRKWMGDHNGWVLAQRVLGSDKCR